MAVAVSKRWRKMRFRLVSPIDGKCLLLASDSQNRFGVDPDSTEDQKLVCSDGGEIIAQR